MTLSRILPITVISVGILPLAHAEEAATAPATSNSTFSIRQAESDSLESVFNAFVATYAKDNIGWKKDIVLTSTPREIPAGRQIGLSERLGYYSFIPKTWCDFSPSEREAVLKDPRMRAFIISTCQPASYPQQNAAMSPASRQQGFDENKPSFPITARPLPTSKIQ